MSEIPASFALNAQTGLIEVSGSESFVEKQIESLQDLLESLMETPRTTSTGTQDL